MAKLRIGLVFGGRSVEHEVSLASATSILGALDPNRYDTRLLAIDHDGRWHLATSALPADATRDAQEVTLPAVPGGHTIISASSSDLGAAGDLDCVFPIVHGRGGEDGSLQGLLELADVPYVGSGVLSSAVQMDKEVTKRLLRDAGLPVVPWVLVRASELAVDAPRTAARVEAKLGMPVFVKPPNLGSSVGISKVTDARDLAAAMHEAARYDTKIMVERAIDARELEVALLGNDPVEASVPGEIRTANEFYDYEAKYVDEDTQLIIPAPLSSELTEEVRSLAIAAFRTLDGAGLGRVDFLMDRATDELFVNEVNGLPGFTDGSMYPLLWEASGLPYSALLDRLIELALERHRIKASLETTYRRS